MITVSTTTQPPQCGAVLAARWRCHETSQADTPEQLRPNMRSNDHWDGDIPGRERDRLQGQDSLPPAQEGLARERLAHRTDRALESACANQSSRDNRISQGRMGRCSRQEAFSLGNPRTPGWMDDSLRSWRCRADTDEVMERYWATRFRYDDHELHGGLPGKLVTKVASTARSKRQGCDRGRGTPH
jgi:hypothetical protein